MKATWSDIDPNGVTFEDNRYEQNDYLAFVALLILCMIPRVNVNLLMNKILNSLKLLQLNINF